MPEQNVPRWRQRPVTNFCFAVYRTALAKLTKQKPTWDVVPPSGDSDDRESARIATALLDHVWRKLNLTKLLKRGIGWLLTTAHLYYRVRWDAEAGPATPQTVPAEVPMLDADGNPIPGLTEFRDVAADESGEPYRTADGEIDTGRAPDLIPQGEGAVELVPSLAVRLNPEAPSIEEADEVLIGTMWPKRKAAKQFGIPPEQLMASTSGETMKSFTDLVSGAMAAVHNALGIGSDQDQAIGERVLVLEYFRKPSAEFRDGRYWVSVGDGWASDEEPLPEGFWPPVVAIDDTPVPGQPDGVALLGQVAPINAKYNRLDGKIQEHNITMAMGGKWLVGPADAKIKITSDPAQVVASQYEDPSKWPKQADLKPLPAEVIAERDRILQQELPIVSAMNELALGKKPEGVSSGRGFLVLQEQVDSVLTPTLFDLERGLEEIGRRLLVLYRKYAQEERIIAIRGEQGQWEFKSFVGSDLADGLDVQVQVGSMFPWSKSARLDTAIDLVGRLPQLVINGDGSVNRQELAKYLGTGGTSAFSEENDPDLSEIAREHAVFEGYTPGTGWPVDPITGQENPPQLGFWQDHAKHLAEHQVFLKRDYARFLKWDPDAQKAFVAHVLQTMQVVGQQVAALMPPGPSQPAAPGAPGGGGPPPGPPNGAPPPSGAPSAPAGAAGAAGANAGQSTQLEPSDFAAAGAA